MAKNRFLDCLLRTLPILILLLCFAAPTMALDIPREGKASFSSKYSGNLETELLAMTNQKRVEQGLEPLVLDEELTQIARKQSDGMALQGFISHELPSGNLKTRMNLSGYRYKTIRENVASSSSLTWAHNALMKSPAHRENILAVDVNRIGIGIVRCAQPYEKEMFITEIFAAPREDPQPAEVQGILMARLEDLRKSGAGALVANPLLAKLASDSVQSGDVAAAREDFRNRVANSTVELQKDGICRVDMNVQLVRDAKNLKVVAQKNIGREARHFGTAIRQVVDSGNEPAFLVLTLIGFANEPFPLF
jgi:hypothetical protein